MVMLVIDTSLGACSAALFDGVSGTILAERYAEMERGHAEALGPMVETLLAEARLLPDSLSRIGTTIGPGTFTGLRIGLSFAKGMGLALAIDVDGIDSLTATAVPHFGSAPRIVVAHKAGATGQFYTACFDGGDGKTLLAPCLMNAEQLTPLLSHGTWLAVGTGLNAFHHGFPGVQFAATHNLPRAASFAAHLFNIPKGTTAAEPLYLRAPDAKPSSSTATATVRAALPEDVPQLAHIHAQSFETGWSADDFHGALQAPGAGALVVELAGTIYGFVQFQWVAGEAEINTLCVLPNYRRQHFGKTLVDGLISTLATRHTDKIFLEVAAGNMGARKLYETAGFSTMGLRKGYYALRDGSREDAVTMQLVLSGGPQ